jgi:hypothetical protein
MKLILIHYLAFRADYKFVCDSQSLTEKIGVVADDILLEEIFRQCNHVDETEWIAGKKLRSLSVDDIVTLIDSDAKDSVREYIVLGSGWERIPNREEVLWKTQNQS